MLINQVLPATSIIVEPVRVLFNTAAGHDRWACGRLPARQVDPFPARESDRSSATRNRRATMVPSNDGRDIGTLVVACDAGMESRIMLGDERGRRRPHGRRWIDV